MLKKIKKNSEYYLVLILVCIAGAILISFYSVAAKTFENIEKIQSKSKLALYQSTIENELLRLKHLPSIIANNPLTINAIKTGQFSSLNQKLFEISNSARAEAIYVMRSDGLTVAASNYNETKTFIGQNYGFRSYFKEAFKGKKSTFFAIGATTFRPGYFLAVPIIYQNNTIGVLALKLDLTALNEVLEETNELIFVTDPNGIVVLSSRQSERYNSIKPITSNINGSKWILHYLVDTSLARQKALGLVAGVAIIMALFALAFVIWRVQRVRDALKVSIEDRMRLQCEIQIRRQAESDLKNAQKELKRSSKMVALGQLSASVTHELGQPISAMKNHIAAEEITKGNLSPVMVHLSGILGRMENITHQLRFFSYSGTELSSEVSLTDIVNNSYELISHDLKNNNIIYETSGLNECFLTWGNQTRLEQVLINLLKNSIKAMSEQLLKKIDISLSQAQGFVIIEVNDTGQGLQGQSLEQIVEPFHTTESSGEGMGLGLAISTSIIHEHGGKLSVSENLDGGACFTIYLPKYNS